MKTLRILTLGLVAGALIAVTGTSMVAAQSAADFYKGRTVTLLIGSGAGGGFDTYGRTLARHMGRHISGKPRILVKNMPGAAGLINANHLYNVAAKDGSVFSATFNTVFMLPLYGVKRAKFDASKFNFIGSTARQTGTCVTWHKSKANSLDKAKGRQIVLGSTGPSSTTTIFPQIFNSILGTKFKVIVGYRTSSLRLALERGEIEGICGMSWQTHKASRPHWIRDHKLNVLAQMGMQKNPEIANVPLVLDMLKKPEDKKVFRMIITPQEFGRPYVAPPGVPAERIAALRAAFMATMKDKKFLADAKKMKMDVDPLDHKTIEKLLAEVYGSSQEVITRATYFALGAGRYKLTKCRSFTDAKNCRKKKKKKKKK